MQNTCQTYLFQNHVYFQNEFYLEKYKKKKSLMNYELIFFF